jgi:hypothetical protein
LDDGIDLFLVQVLLFHKMGVPQVQKKESQKNKLQGLKLFSSS